jgi:hypothetical protein
MTGLNILTIGFYFILPTAPKYVPNPPYKYMCFEGLLSHDATHVKKISMSETIGVTRKDDVWCWASDLMVVAEVVCGINSACVFIRTLYPC